MASIYFLHGFLGKPEDWGFLKDAFPKHQCIFLNLFHGFNPKKSLQSFASTLNDQLVGCDNILIGYSLGGRLGLHALLKNPDRWQAAVLISTHTGLATEIQRKMRLQHDQSWAKRFLVDDWAMLMKDWNQQSVLLTSYQIERKECDFNRVILADALLNWSLGHQFDLCYPISQFSQPVYWMVGEKDDYFRNLTDRMQFGHSSSKILKIKNAGHRVPWDQQQVFVSEIQSLLSVDY